MRKQLPPQCDIVGCFSAHTQQVHNHSLHKLTIETIDYPVAAGQGVELILSMHTSRQSTA